MNTRSMSEYIRGGGVARWVGVGGAGGFGGQEGVETLFQAAHLGSIFMAKYYFVSMITKVKISYVGLYSKLFLGWGLRWRG